MPIMAVCWRCRARAASRMLDRQTLLSPVASHPTSTLSTLAGQGSGLSHWRRISPRSIELHRASSHRRFTAKAASSTAVAAPNTDACQTATTANPKPGKKRYPTTGWYRTAGASTDNPAALRQARSTLHPLELELERLIKKAIESKDVPKLFALWRGFTPEVDGGRPQRVLRNGLCAFLYAFNQLGEPEEALRCWAFLAHYRLSPSRRAWHTLFAICRCTHNLPALNAAWQQMSSSDGLITNTSWRLYLQGLFSCHAWRQALAELENLGKWWRSVETTPNAERTQDFERSPETVNIVISGLLQKELHTQADSVLQWAAKEGVPRNHVTYNVLIQHAISKLDLSRAQELFGEMDDKGLTADLNTFGIVFRGFWIGRRQLQACEAKQQEETVLGALDRAVDAGIVPTPAMYGNVLSALFRNGDADYQPNWALIDKVVSHMRQHHVAVEMRAMQPLLRHYLQSRPPKLAAFDELWAELQRNASPVSKWLYNYVIFALAECGELDRTLACLRTSNILQKNLEYHTLRALLQLFWERKERALSQELVDAAMRDRGLEGHRPTQRGRVGLMVLLRKLLQEGWVKLPPGAVLPNADPGSLPLKGHAQEGEDYTQEDE